MLADINAAARDADLITRATAAAAAAGIPNPQAWAEAHAWQIAAHKIDGTDQLIADVYAYGVSTAPPRELRPGEDPAAVTDAHLTDAVAAIHTAASA